MMLYSIGTYGHYTSPPAESSATYQKVRPRFLNALGEVSAPPAPQVPAAETKYTVKSGDTLAEIVRRQLQAQGQPADSVAVFDKVKEVASANHMRNANKLQVGQILDLGALGAASQSVLPEKIQNNSASLALPTAPPSIDVSVLPPLPRKSAPDAIVQVTPLDTTSSAKSTVPESSGGGGRIQPIGPLAALTPENALLMSPGAQGGPSHPLSRGLLSDLSPNVHYPLGNPVSRPDLNSLLDRLLAPKEAAASAVVAPSSAVGAPSGSDTPWTRAVDAPTRLTSVYGARKDPFNHRPDFHEGIDLAAASGSDVHALKSGTVSFSGWKSGYGRVVIVDHADGTQSLYGHNSKNLVSPGQQVTEKTVLAHVGSTGRATGPHLHLEVRQNGKAIDPIAYLTANTAAPTDSTRIAMNE